MLWEYRVCIISMRSPWAKIFYYNNQIITSSSFLLNKASFRQWQYNPLENIISDPNKHCKIILNIFIFSLVGNLSSALFITLTGILPAVITGTNPSELGNFPNYIFVYLHHLVIPECVIFIAIFVYFFPNKQLMDMYRRQFTTMIDYVKNCLSFRKA